MLLQCLRLPCWWSPSAETCSQSCFFGRTSRPSLSSLLTLYPPRHATQWHNTRGFIDIIQRSYREVFFAGAVQRETVETQHHTDATVRLKGQKGYLDQRLMERQRRTYTIRLLIDNNFSWYTMVVVSGVVGFYGGVMEKCWCLCSFGASEGVLGLEEHLRVREEDDGSVGCWSAVVHYNG